MNTSLTAEKSIRRKGIELITKRRTLLPENLSENVLRAVQNLLKSHPVILIIHKELLILLAFPLINSAPGITDSFGIHAISQL